MKINQRTDAGGVTVHPKKNREKSESPKDPKHAMKEMGKSLLKEFLDKDEPERSEKGRSQKGSKKKGNS
jgi:hypothetical protein